MQYKEIDPACHNFISTGAYDFLEIAQLRRSKGYTSDNSAVANLRHHAVNHNQLRPAFTPQALAMHMYRLMLIGVNNPKYS